MTQEDDLGAIQRRYELILQTTGEGIFGTDADGIVTFVNPAAAKMLGYAPSDIIGKDAHDLFHAKRLDGSPMHRDECPILATLRDGAAHHVRGGEVFWARGDKPVMVEYVSVPIRGNDGQRAGATIIFKSTDERDRREQALRESEERFKRLSDATMEGVVITENGKFLDANQTFAAMTGHDVRDLVGKSVLDLVAPASHDLVARQLRANVEGSYEAALVTKDGATMPVEISAKSMPYHGRMVRVATVRDITDRKRAEAAVDRSSRRIVEFYENIPDAFFALDREWRIVYLNPVALRMTPPQNRGKYVGKILWDVFPDLKGTRFDVEYHRAMDERSPIHVEEYFARMGRWFEADAYPSDEGLAVFFRDITARKEAEEQLRVASIARPLVRKIVQDLVEVGGVAHQILQQVGRKFAADLNAKDLEGFIRGYGEAGLGDLSIERKEEERFSFVGSDLLEKRPGSRVATCYFTLGFLSEAVSRVSQGEPTLGTEIECQSRGSQHCKFIVQVRKAEEGLARRVKELV